MEKLKHFDTVLIHKESYASAMAQRLLSEGCHFLKSRPLIVDEGFFTKGRLSADRMEKSKKTLYLKPFKGRFFKRCPGQGPRLLCCNYYVLNLGQHCEMDCSYCYLQSFINFPAVVVYTNIEAALDELSLLRRDFKNQYLRIGTGEQTDSLSLDGISRYGGILIDFFKNCPRWLLEFKTKSDNIRHIESIPHAGNVIVSWSLNPEGIVQSEEHGTASLKARLRAAERARDKGFLVSFHIDPVIFHKGWRESYSGLVERITSLFRPSDVRHISLGALRFPPRQWALMRERFGMQSEVLKGEFFKSADGRLRYDSALRQAIFQFILQEFKKRDRLWPVFICMETPENWSGAGFEKPLKDPLLQKDFKAVPGLSPRSGAARRSGPLA